MVTLILQLLPTENFSLVKDGLILIKIAIVEKDALIIVIIIIVVDIKILKKKVFSFFFYAIIIIGESA